MTIIRIMIALAFMSTAAQAYCRPFAQLEFGLENRFQETRYATAFMSEKWRMVLYVANDGSWTMLRVNAAGIACLVAAGKNFEKIKAIKPGQKT